MQQLSFVTIKKRINTLVQSSFLANQPDPEITKYLLITLGIALSMHLFCISSMTLLVEEAYYWNYAQHLDFSYLDHPPMVALLIKLSTSIFGNTEFGVRAISLLCWAGVAFFSYQLTQLVREGAGIYALILLAILPFFFLHAQIITPDVPLIACWSASLYCLYRALVLNEAPCWYGAGICLGMGMLSKYTIALLGLATLFYLVTVPAARFWFKRKEPYLCALIALLIFTPVIYWNATHQWASFIFQSSRRISSTSSIRLHQVIGLTLLFLMPIGMYGIWELMKKKDRPEIGISSQSKYFIRMFILVPYTVFALFSLNHPIKFNWIGPISLALIPWLAALLATNARTRLGWLKSCIFLLGCYCVLLSAAYFNKSEVMQDRLFKSFIAWDALTVQFHEIAVQIEADTKKTPTFVPLDSYHIASELAFYQAKFSSLGHISKTYPVAGSDLFGNNSLMYRYWSNITDYLDRPLILISTQLEAFENNYIKAQTIDQSGVKKIVSSGQGQGVISSPYYYKIVKMK